MACQGLHYCGYRCPYDVSALLDVERCPVYIVTSFDHLAPGGLFRFLFNKLSGMEEHMVSLPR